MIGQTISHYRILEMLGEGGMGVVYRAEDTKLHRHVALKFPPQGVFVQGRSKERFIREARALATVNHPNVASIYGVEEHAGDPFIVMELVEGTTLHHKIQSRGPLPIPEALQIATQIAAGLQAIHARGVVHRDIKSPNVLVDDSGQVKIADFGLAFLPGGTRVTREGATVGTVAYMSPEQARGENVDHRTDLWSFGVILYEMLTGHLPFTSGYEQAVVYNILHSTPLPPATLRPGIPANILQVLDRCLAKEPHARYSDAASIFRDLRDPSTVGINSPGDAVRTTGRRSVTKVVLAAFALILLVVAGTLWLAYRDGKGDAAPLSIAVLPFDNLGDSSTTYTTFGIADAISSDLGTTAGFTVIDSRSAARVIGREGDVRKAAEEMGVHYILAGSVQRSATILRIVARILDAHTYVQIWSEKFERPADEVLAMEDDIAEGVVGVFRPNAMPAARARQHAQPTTSAKAYDLYLSGKYFLDRRLFQRTDTAIALFQKAIELDRHFALAYAALGRAYSAKVFVSDANREQEEKASVAIDRALQENPLLAEAYVARAALLWTRANGFPHERAARELLKAIAINPNLVEAHEWLGSIYLHIGLLEKSLTHLHKALQLDPASTIAPPRIGRVLWYQQHYAESLERFQELPPGQWRDERARVLYYLGRTDEAFATLRDTSGGSDADPGLSTRTREDASVEITSAFAFLFAATGDTLQALRYIGAAQQRGNASSHYHHSEYTIACAYALLRKNSLAIEWLRRTAEDGYPCYPLFLTDPPLASLRDEPQYRELLERLKREWQRWDGELQ